jgi:protein KTI12
VQRLLSKSTLLIVDAPNYIKGFRYQMFCAAKEAGVRVCTVSSRYLTFFLLSLL